MTQEQGTGKYEQLLVRCRELTPVDTAVVQPCDARALLGAKEAAAKGLIRPILVGPAAKIRAAADEAGITLADLEIVDAPHSHGAAAAAVALV